MLWTEEAVEALRRLALEGRSATMIAAALGAASRNAVIGKANRIGVKLGGGSAARRGGRAGRRAAAAAEDRPEPALVPRRQPPPPPSLANAEAEVDLRRREGWRDVEGRPGGRPRSQCRWPVGDPIDEDFAYCGLQPAAGRSYCAGHCRMAYRPPGAAPSEGRREWRWRRDPGPLRAP